jgi:hypothetical protein
MWGITKAQAPAQPGTVVLGYTLGMHHDSIPKLNLLKMGKFQKLLRYDRQDEALKLEGIDLQFIRLFIWDNQLHSIEVKTAEGQGDQMFKWLQSVYGAGKKQDAMGYRYAWFAPTMRVLWDHNLGTKEGVAQFVDEATNDKYYKYMYNRQNGN